LARTLGAGQYPGLFGEVSRGTFSHKAGTSDFKVEDY
jgi:hypothetical protein